jgi:hypothetical protein
MEEDGAIFQTHFSYIDIGRNRGLLQCIMKKKPDREEPTVLHTVVQNANGHQTAHFHDYWCGTLSDSAMFRVDNIGQNRAIQNSSLLDTFTHCSMHYSHPFINERELHMFVCIVLTVIPFLRFHSHHDHQHRNMPSELYSVGRYTVWTSAGNVVNRPEFLRFKTLPIVL